MAGDHDDHDGPIHQATWVPGMTIGICLGFVTMMVLIRIFFAAELGAAI